MAVVPELPKGVGFGTTEFHVLRPTKAIDARLLYYFVASASVRHEAQHNMTGAVGQKRVPKRFLEKKEFPLPPLNEQHRIVEKIETLFARIDKGKEALREVQKLLKRYRQSILKAAVTGELTRDWREANQHKLEPASDLLARILEARRENWQGGGKYKEPACPERVNLPQLPDEWIWAGPEQLSKAERNSMCIGPFGSNLKVADYQESGVPLIFVRHIRSQDFQGNDAKFVSEKKAKELSSHRVYPGDLLITKMGDPPGDVAIYPEDAPIGVITADCIRLSITEIGLSLPYLELAISSPQVQAQIKRISKGVAQQKVSLANFKRIGLPIPPFAEQCEITPRVTQVLARADELERACEAELSRSSALRQSILKSAFTGQLVPQDPNDEPASELLSRIRADRQATPKKHPKKTTVKKSRARV